MQLGMALMAIGVMFAPVSDSLSKILTQWLHPVEVGVGRFLLQTAILFAVMALRGMPLGHKGQLPRLALAGLLVSITLVGIIGAVSVMPIATAIAIFFVEPLILTVMAAVILKEPTGWRRYVAVFVGLIGALIVIRPSWETFGPVSILPLIAAFSFSGYLINMRWLGRSLPGLSIQGWSSGFAAVFLGLAFVIGKPLGLLPSAIETTPLWGWSLFGLLAIVAVGTFLFISEAFLRAPAGILAPFQYLEIIGATVLGFVLFGDFPDAMTWLGTAIILGSGLYVFYRERKQSRADAAARPVTK